MRWLFLLLLLCAPATAQVVTGPPGVASSSPLFNPALLPAALYLPPGYTFGKLTGGNPSTFASLGISLADAQARYGAGVVASTARYVDDVVVTYALATATTLSATQGLTCVVLPPGTQYWDQQITFDGSKVCIIGAGTRGSFGTSIFTQTVGAGTAALRITGGYLSGRRVVDGVVFAAFNSGVVFMPGATGGVAAPGGVPSGMTVPSGFYYYTGAIALALDNVAVGQMQDVGFYNYDTPMTYLTGNVYIWDFINFIYQYNNQGININTIPPNSLERMHWTGGATSNNNYNVSLQPGVGASGSLFIDNMSIDYPTSQYHIVTDFGGAAGNDMQMSLTLSNNHIETDSTHSGTGCRIFNSGVMQVLGNNFSEHGTFPVGLICPTFYARETVSNNVLPGQGQGGTYVPAVYAASAITWPPLGSGNNQRYGGDVQLFNNQGQITMSSPTVYSSGAVINTSYTLGLIFQLPVNYLNTGGTITVPPDAVANHAIGTVISFQITDTSLWTIACAGPPTCSGPLVGIGGVAGTKFTATKTAANVWVVSSMALGSTSQSTVAAPVAPASTAAYKMQGLAGTITPKVSGNVLLTISGTCLGNTVTAGDGIQFQLSYGTGGAPANAGTLAGTQTGTIQRCQNPATVIVADISTPFSAQALITGLTPGTAYWLDLAAESLGTVSSGKLSAVSITAVEIK